MPSSDDISQAFKLKGIPYTCGLDARHSSTDVSARGLVSCVGGRGGTFLAEGRVVREASEYTCPKRVCLQRTHLN